MLELNAVIFDMDGLMIDTEPVGKMLVKTSHERFGYEITEDMFYHLIGTNEKTSKAYYHSVFGEDYPYQKIKDYRDQLRKEYFNSHPLEVKKGLYDLLEDLNNTNVPKNEDYNKTLMDRIKVFLDIIFSKEIYELDDYKYNVVLDMASIVEDINELSKLKKKIVFYNRLTDEDFEVTLDDSVDTLTDTSIKLLKEGKSKTLKFQEIDNNK